MIDKTNNGLPCVAILDDDIALCRFMEEVAQMAGFGTITAHDGGELPQLLAVQPAWLVLDLAMANVDGIEVIRALAASQFSGRLVIVSGHSTAMLQSAKTLAELQGLKVAGVLIKPIRADTLRTLLQGPEVAATTPATRPTVNIDDLARAIDNDELTLHYQPQVRLRDGLFVGMEALVRWQHPQYGLLYPEAFIALAEHGGLALQLTRKVIDMALNGCARATSAFGFAGTVSVNLSPAAMTDVTLPETVAAAVARIGYDPTRLMFEMTETSVPPDPAKALDILTRLRLKGFALSIDDFGTGHSSLENLQQLPFTELKIDLGFVRVAETDTSARLIVENSIQLGGQLGLTVIAEGVENIALWRWLRTAGCELAQGYFITKALPLEHIAAWKSEWETRRLQLS
jgi:EAL domain-containing protein (putative c-di-GMP-specific phosphodiesterase class I)